MGDGYGPVVVAGKDTKPGDLKDKRIAAPGTKTTAALVAQMALPGARLVHMPFDKITEAVLKGEVDAGILIHEGQLTYTQDRLICLLDLGKWWKKEKGLPLPLGIDVIRKDLPPETIAKLSQILKGSIVYALEHREEALKYALQFGRGLSGDLADRFVGMYVNHYTVDYGPAGRRAVKKLLDEAYQARLIPAPCIPEFIS
jgi:1,4-dihydroxy-6-naphthoate synthase